MSLNVDLRDDGDIVFSWNITHNLTTMASNIPVDNKGNTLYNIMWRPDEMTPKKTKAKQIAVPLTKALMYISTHKDELSKFNPENGWCSLNSLEMFAREYLVACYTNPNAKLEIYR